MKKQELIGDYQLVKKIFSGKTKDPITCQNWFLFVETTFTTENSLCYVEICKFTEIYHRECQKIKLNSQITEEILVVGPVPGMQDFNCDIKSEDELKQWAETICSKIINKFVKTGAEMEINISSKAREECLAQIKAGRFHPLNFVDIQKSVLDDIVGNDLTKFKQFALDQNIQIQHRRWRLVGALVFLMFSGVFYGFVMGFQVEQYYRLLGLPLLYEFVIFYFQWKMKFCVVFAAKKKINTNGYQGVPVEDEYVCEYQAQRAKKIRKKSMLIALILYIILFVVPPFKWQ
eukprot:NODE_12_length_54577_cov_0.384100.p22 type:complete len:289 gc:universal NODE_12_length_54577_cov_0.384100:12613-13479(+)